MQEGVSQNSFVFQITNIAVLNGELVLLKAILENQNFTCCRGVAMVNASIVIKDRHYLQSVLNLLSLCAWMITGT